MSLVVTNTQRNITLLGSSSQLCETFWCLLAYCVGFLACNFPLWFKLTALNVISGRQLFSA